MPQPATFLRLPLEIRRQIYIYALTTSNKIRRMSEPLLTPVGWGKKFVDFFPEIYPDAAFGEPMHRINLNLALICRQTCLDVIGGGLLYSHVVFVFVHQSMMNYYISRINPAHVAQIRSLRLTVKIYRSRQKIDGKVFRTLGQMTALQHLQLKLTNGSGLDPESLLRRIEAQSGWNQIRGLRSFSLKFDKRPSWLPPLPRLQAIYSGENTDVTPFEDTIKRVVMRQS